MKRIIEAREKAAKSNKDISSKYKSNKNIFTESSYELKRDMTFQEKYEYTCQKLYLTRGVKVITLLNVYFSIFHLVNLFRFKENGIYCLLRIPALIVHILLFFFMNNIKRMINNSTGLRVMTYIMHSINIFSYCKSLPDDYSQKENPENYNNFFRLSIFGNIYFFTILVNHIFCFGYSKSALFFGLDSVMLLSFYGYKNEFFLKRLISNFFSQRLIISIFYFMIAIFIQGIFNNPRKKLWAMYDSFKKSYFSVRSIFDNISLPVMVINQDLTTIYYKNPAAETFCQTYRKELQKENGYTFKDIFHLHSEKDEKSFRKELENSLKKKSGFFFPFVLGNATLESIANNNHDFGEFESTNATTKYIKMYCYECLWKEKFNCYEIMISENLFVFHGGRVTMKNLKQINNELEKLIWNINTICLNLNEMQLTSSDDTSPKNRNSSWTSVLSPRKLRNNSRKLSKKIKSNYLAQLSGKNESKKRSSFSSSPNNKEDVSTVKIDKLIFYYLHLSANFITDLTLTNHLYNSFVGQKTLHDLRRMDFNNFLDYMVDYLSPFALKNNFKLEIKEYLNEKELVCNYIYIREIFFNIIMFITQNSKDPKMKTLSITPEHFYFGSGQDGGSFYQIKFNFNDSKPILDYNYLKAKFFDLYDYKNFLLNNQEENFSFINFNFLIPSLISDTQFNLDALGDIGPKPKQFQLECFESHNYCVSIIIYLQKKGDKEGQYKQFPPINQYDYYYWDIKKILADTFVDNDSFFEVPEFIFDNGKDDEFEKTSEDFTFSKDKNDVCRLRILKLEESNKGKYVSFEQKLNSLQKFKLKFKNNKNKNNIIGKKIKFKISDFETFEIPRIIVLEDRTGNRSTFIDEFEKLKFTCNIDVAADGWDLLEKYNRYFKIRKLYDYIIVDLDKDNLKGYEVVKIIREREKKANSDTKIIGIMDTQLGKRNIEIRLFNRIIDRPFDERSINKAIFFD